MSNNSKQIKESIRKYDDLIESKKYLTESERQMLNHKSFKNTKHFIKLYKQV
jgi:hypothetical protein